MQYKVPQNVQRADTIIFNLTLVQMIILGAGFGISYGLYITLAENYIAAVWVPPIILVVGITLLFAFIKIHGLSFTIFAASFFTYHYLPKKRIWLQCSDNYYKSVVSSGKKADKNKKKELPKKPQGKVRSFEELTSILDTHGKSELNEGNKGQEESTDEDGQILSKEERKKEIQKIINQNYQ